MYVKCIDKGLNINYDIGKKYYLDENGLTTNFSDDTSLDIVFNIKKFENILKCKKNDTFKIHGCTFKVVSLDKR